MQGEDDRKLQRPNADIQRRKCAFKNQHYWDSSSCLNKYHLGLVAIHTSAMNLPSALLKVTQQQWHSLSNLCFGSQNWLEYEYWGGWWTSPVDSEITRDSWNDIRVTSSRFSVYFLNGDKLVSYLDQILQIYSWNLLPSSFPLLCYLYNSSNQPCQPCSINLP